MLGRSAQRRGNERKSEEKRDKGRFFESSNKDLNPLRGTEASFLRLIFLIPDPSNKDLNPLRGTET